MHTTVKPNEIAKTQQEYRSKGYKQITDKNDSKIIFVKDFKPTERFFFLLSRALAIVATLGLNKNVREDFVDVLNLDTRIVVINSSNKVTATGIAALKTKHILSPALQQIFPYDINKLPMGFDLREQSLDALRDWTTDHPPTAPIYKFMWQNELCVFIRCNVKYKDDAPYTQELMLKQERYQENRHQLNVIIMGTPLAGTSLNLSSLIHVNKDGVPYTEKTQQGLVWFQNLLKNKPFTNGDYTYSLWDPSSPTSKIIGL